MKNIVSRLMFDVFLLGICISECVLVINSMVYETYEQVVINIKNMNIPNQAECVSQGQIRINLT